jgi:phospholipase A1
MYSSHGRARWRGLRCRGACLLLALAALAPAARASAEDCRSIADDAKRLACYDAQAGRPAPEPGTAAEPETALQKRERSELALQSEQFALTPYRTNYFLPLTYVHHPDFAPYGAEDGDLKQYEAKYQFSLRTLLWPDAFRSRLYLWAAFTIQSWWQAYDSGGSSPFRETDYEPEIFLSRPLNGKVFGWRLHRYDLGLNHQSNGRGGSLSRSWNRLVGLAAADRGEYVVHVRAWVRLPETGSDDNPDVERYMGQMEVGIGRSWNRHTLGLIVKNNLRADNKSGVQVDWSFPLAGHLKGYSQLYAGYGENLVDGPNNQLRLGLGLMLTDWL